MLLYLTKVTPVLQLAWVSKPDYPKTILEFAAQFHSDEVCLDYLPSPYLSLGRHLDASVPRSHSAFIAFARGWSGRTGNFGIHHGVDPKYLQACLDEYVFRFNRRGTPMAAFQTLLGIATGKKPVTRGRLLEP